MINDFNQGKNKAEEVKAIFSVNCDNSVNLITRQFFFRKISKKRDNLKI